MTEALPDPASVKAIRKAGIEKLVAERQETHFSIKELEAKKGKLSAQIMGLMMKFDIAKLQVGEFPVALVTDGKQTKFDRDGFINYLIESGVDPKLISKAKGKFLTEEPKKPFITIRGGGDE